MQDFLQFTIQGLSIGSIYGLVAVGLTLAYNVSGAVSLAQGYLAVIGVLATYSIMQVMGLPLLPAAALGMLLVMVLGLLQERLTIRPILGAPLSVFLILTLGFARLLNGVAKEVWGTDPYRLPNLSGGETTELLGLRVSTQSLWVLGVLLAVTLCLFCFFRVTILGKSMRAVAEDRITAGMFGINASQLNLWTFGIGAALGALAGILLAPLSFVTYDTGGSLGLMAMVAAIVGGLSNPFGAILGGLVLGLGEAYSVGYLSSLFKDVTTYGLLLTVLLARSYLTRAPRPEGLRGGFSVQARAPAWLSRHSRFVAVLALLAVFLLPYVLNLYLLGVAVVVGIKFIVVLGLDLLFGFTGLLSLGQGAFMGIGAYGSAILTTKFGLPHWQAMLLAALAVAALAWVIAVSATRLTSFAFATATLAVAFIVSSVQMGWQSMTRGGTGISGIQPLHLFGISFADPILMYYLVAVAAALAALLAYNLTGGRIGRSLRAVRADIQGAESLGINAAVTKIKIFVFSAVLASVSGSLYAHNLGYVCPELVGVNTSLAFLLMLIMGGMGTIWGGLLGVAVLEFLPQLLGAYQRYLFIAQGLLIIILLIFLPAGLAHLLAQFPRVLTRFLPQAARRENTP